MQSTLLGNSRLDVVVLANKSDEKLLKDCLALPMKSSKQLEKSNTTSKFLNRIASL